MSVKRAIDDGSPVRNRPWVTGFQGSEEFGDLEKDYVCRVLDKRRVFRFLGDMDDSEARKVEEAYCRLTGAKHALAVNSGTSALIAALNGAGIGPGDEVIIPAYTFVASAAAVLAVRAVPVICEVDDSLTMDPAAFAAAITPHTKAVMPVHMRGIPCDMDPIMKIAVTNGLVVIEDVAQANGGTYHGRWLGTIGNAGCFSFQQYKVITAGEGGLVISDDAHLISGASMAHDSAIAFWRVPGDWDRQFAGENYRMSEINAALVLAQIERLPGIVAKMRELKADLVAGLSGLSGLEPQRVPDPAGDVGVCTIFFLPDKATAQRFSDALAAEGIPNGTMFNNGICDRHIYVNWEYVLEKRAATPVGCPWSCGFYKGNVQYSREMCPKTLDYLGRAIHIALSQRLTPVDIKEAVTAIRKVAEAIL